ncbi:hypothetical protein FLAG1_05135 [Fusarium langsethiae]|uniref:C3H1-type domain-containing protein n=1 Tax=Fusarium langsethiae TaxID=179993 RepID=A0A0N0V722_FUSLA|nr:hypothetical protein FLAG1_05135 [Fusarium langsethiae]GKU01854.1 unnamed protein product [Fusarium langsethiae]GKU12511.1 unnamed protein product [Fusarium langsethiae]
MRQHQAQKQTSSPLHWTRSSLPPPYTSKGVSVHRRTPIPNKQPNSPAPPGAMNQPNSFEFPSNGRPEDILTVGYPAPVMYGGWQQNSHHQLPTPRSTASGNWRGSQPSVDGMNPFSVIHYSDPPLPLSNDGGPVSISDCLNGFAYCLKRPSGRYTRLIPADMLPVLNELPATQVSAQGMVLLPDLNMKPPQGVAGMNQPVTNRIDRIVATTSPVQQRRTKIYCDKWIHDGTCAFTQQGCKYKHEMPFDKATQQSLGLFHGFPKWWRDHQEELQKQHNKDSPTTRNQAVLQADWRGDSNEDTANAAAVQAPIGAERLQPPFKSNGPSPTRDKMAVTVENRPRTGSETDWAVSPSTVQGWHGSSPRSTAGSLDHGCIRAGVC